MASFNQVILMGNLTRDPQVRYTQAGKAVAELGLAINETWFDKEANQKRENVTFLDVTFFGRQAEVAGEYLQKGASVQIVGKLTVDEWEDKSTGQKRSKTKVQGKQLIMLGSPRGGQRQEQQQESSGGYYEDAF